MLSGAQRKPTLLKEEVMQRILLIDNDPGMDSNLKKLFEEHQQ